MFELGIVALVVVGVFWFMGALIGGLFKLTFGLIAALCGGMLALFGVGMAALIVVPIVLFTLIPFMLPALAAAAVVWLLVRPARPAPRTRAWR